MVGITFAVFTRTLTSNDNTLNTGRISMSYTEPSNALILENALPMTDEEGKAQTKYFEFTVATHATTNANDDTGITIPYEINISDLTTDSGMTTLSKSYVKVNLVTVSGTAETEVAAPTLLSNMMASTLREGATRVYKTSDTHKNNSATKTTTYRLRAWIDKSFDASTETTYQYKFSVNVNSQVNAVGVEYPSEVTGPTEGTLAYAILGANNTNVVDSGDGLYVSTATNDGSPTYYYRGAVENNYVDFAEKTWRVVRINEDGTIKIILQNGINEDTSYAFLPTNDNNNSIVIGEYKYMYYSNSVVDVTGGIKNRVDDWYASNIATSYDGYVSTASFCEAAKVAYYMGEGSGNATMEFASNYTPNFECPLDGNGKQYVTTKAGLITADEVAMAGMPLAKTYSVPLDSNTNTYLQYGKLYWTMSPAGFDPYADYLSYAWFVDSGGYANADIVLGGYIDEQPVIRPVINLNTDVTVTGTGEAGSPWIVQTN